MTDVNTLLRQMVDNPSVVDTWNEAQTDAVLTKFGVDTGKMKDTYENKQIDPSIECMIAFLMDHPEMIPRVPSRIMDQILEYLGATSDPAIVKAAFHEAGIT